MRLEQVFTGRGAPVLMTHVYYGDPNKDFSIKQVKALLAGGADIIELGIPFSDPTADGPVFQRACRRALENGTTPQDVIRGIADIREQGILSPILITSYYNIIHRMGTARFLKRIKEAGADGVIIPNLPLEESDEMLEEAGKAGISVIFLVAPTTTDERLKRILRVASGFLYLVSVTGTTGAREDLGKGTLDLVKRVRKHSDIPLLVGFGISTPEHAAQVVDAGADGVIIGSAIGRIYEQNLDEPESTLAKIEVFARRIKGTTINGLAKHKSTKCTHSYIGSENTTTGLNITSEIPGNTTRRDELHGNQRC